MSYYDKNFFRRNFNRIFLLPTINLEKCGWTNKEGNIFFSNGGKVCFKCITVNELDGSMVDGDYVETMGEFEKMIYNIQCYSDTFLYVKQLFQLQTV